MPPPRPPKAKAVVPVSKGSKKTFDDADDLELDFGSIASSSKPKASSSSSKKRPVVVQSDESDDGSDDAPEAVGMGAGKSSAMKDLEDVKRFVAHPLHPMYRFSV